MLIKLKTLEQLIAENQIPAKNAAMIFYDKNNGLPIQDIMIPNFGNFIETDGMEQGHLTYRGYFYAFSWCESSDVLNVLYGKPNAK